MSPDITQRLAALAASQVGDSQDRFGMVDGALRPVWIPPTTVGRAFTVQTAGGDNKVIHEAIPLLQPGDVLFVDGQGATHRALLGELMTERIKRRGAVAIVVDGAVRDAQGITALQVPVYARAITPAGPYRNGPGRIGVPIAVGGVVVTHGDWVIADADGVCVVEQARIEDVLAKAEKKRAAEEAQQDGIRAGTVI